MDLWYELALREMGDLNEEVNELIQDAEEANAEPLLVAADDEDEEGE